MWSLPQFILWLARRQAGTQLGFHYIGADTINNDEAFAQRINGDLNLRDFQKAVGSLSGRSRILAQVLRRRSTILKQSHA